MELVTPEHERVWNRFSDRTNSRIAHVAFCCLILFGLAFTPAPQLWNLAWAVGIMTAVIGAILALVFVVAYWRALLTLFVLAAVLKWSWFTLLGG